MCLSFHLDISVVSVITIVYTCISLFEEWLQIHKCVANGGKVLIPTFALGRAQVLCYLSITSHCPHKVLFQPFVCN